MKFFPTTQRTFFFRTFTRLSPKASCMAEYELEVAGRPMWFEGSVSRCLKSR